jgi:hypothetical protein
MEPCKNYNKLFDAEILVEVVNGRIDLDAVALKELKNRGLDRNGKWVGFGKQFSVKQFISIFYLVFLIWIIHTFDIQSYKN